MTTNHTPDRLVDPTGPLTVGTIPDDDLGRMIAATVPAGTTALPAGFHTDDDPDADLRTYVGTPHGVAGRQVAAYAVVELDHGGRLHDGLVRVEVGEAERDLTLRQARAFACAVTAAADDLLAASPAHPLDTVSTAAIWTEIVQRVTGPGALRTALAAADPAALTPEDRLALLDLVERAFDAAGIE